jgi:hypothetical protein
VIRWYDPTAKERRMHSGVVRSPSVYVGCQLEDLYRDRDGGHLGGEKRTIYHREDMSVASDHLQMNDAVHVREPMELGNRSGIRSLGMAGLGVNG